MATTDEIAMLADIMEPHIAYIMGKNEKNVMVQISCLELAMQIMKSGRVKVSKTHEQSIQDGDYPG